MTEPTNAAAEKRARWRGYFTQHIDGPQAEIDAATDAAMRALERGADADGIIAAGLDGARAHREAQLAPAPQPPPTSALTSAARLSLAATSAVPISARAGAPSVVGSESRGRVNGLQQRQEMFGRTYLSVWSFRLDRTDAAGNQIAPIAVEMRGRRFSGAVNNGDIVDVGQKSRPGKIVAPTRVRNISTGVEVRAIGKRHPVARVFGIICAIAFIGFWIALVATFALKSQ